MTAIPAEQILFLDIETVSQKEFFEDLPEDWQSLWDEKTQWQRQEQGPEEFYPHRAGILAEFGKVVCISCGFLRKEQEGYKLRVKSFEGEDEKRLLSDFADLLAGALKHYYLCAHNGKEFDFPYLCRRMLIQGIALPPLLNISGKKPWEVPFIDTLELWKFGDRKNYTSLKLLAAVFDIPTPKDDIDGSMVGAVYWQSHDLERIVRYCEKDVLTLAKVYLKITAQQAHVEIEAS